MKYQDTVQLPKTEFPMRANLPQREPLIQERWLKEDFYRQLRERRRGQPKYILHDGPPYANGHIHLGTAVNKVLKDIVIRSRTMTGMIALCSGLGCTRLPIEHALVRQLGVDRHALSPVEFRQKCKNSLSTG